MTESLLYQEADKNIRNYNVTVTQPTSGKPDCSHQPLVMRNSQNSNGRVNVLISCNTPKWQQFMSAQVDGELPVIISTQDIPNNTPITRNMMTQSWIPANQMRPQYYHSIKEIEDKTSSKSIRANSILANNMLKNTQLIQKDQEVTVTAQHNGLHIELRAIALENGELNQRIRLKNLSSGKTLQGKVVSADSVIVELNVGHHP
jgi:flagella basal body P-ring formation protein FlgA